MANRLILILLQHIILLNCEIKFNFKRNKEIYKNIPKGKEPMDYLMKNIIETNINLGTPLQEIPLKIDSSVYTTSILGEESENITNIKTFKKNISKTYTKIKYHNVLYSTGFTSGETSKETFQLENKNNNTLYNNISFFYGIISNQPEVSGYLGLSLICGEPDIESYSFPIQLKEMNITKNYAFQIEYTDDDKGNLIIGNDNYDHTSPLINKTNIAKIDNKIQYWAINFDSILYGNLSFGNQSSEENNIVRFEFGNNYLGSNSLYRKVIYDNFFKEKIEKKECFENDSFGEYTYFYCNKRTDVSKMQDLIFVNKNMNRNFSLTYNDLFLEFNDFNYFLVIFPKEFEPHNDYFTIGYPFLKKYSLLFDSQNKIIVFMKEYQPFPLMKVLLMILALIVIIFLIFIIVFILKKPKRKKRVNEIAEDFEYLPQNDKNNKLVDDNN